MPPHLLKSLPIAAALTVVVAGAANADPRSLGPGRVVADGDRYAYVQRDDTVRVRNDRTGNVTKRASPGCAVTAATSAIGLLTCDAGSPNRIPRLFTPGLAAVRDIPGALPPQTAATELIAIGTQWIRGLYSDGRCCGTAYVSLHTGQFRIDISDPNRDLDSATLKPARRYLVRKRRVLTLHTPTGNTILDRDADQSTYRLVGHRAAWSTVGGLARFYDTRTRKTTTIDVKKLLGPRTAISQTTATATAVYFTAAPTARGTYRVYRQRWR